MGDIGATMEQQNNIQRGTANQKEKFEQELDFEPFDIFIASEEGRAFLEKRARNIALKNGLTLSSLLLMGVSLSSTIVLPELSAGSGPPAESGLFGSLLESAPQALVTSFVPAVAATLAGSGATLAYVYAKAGARKMMADALEDIQANEFASKMILSQLNLMLTLVSEELELNNNDDIEMKKQAEVGMVQAKNDVERIIREIRVEQFKAAEKMVGKKCAQKFALEPSKEKKSDVQTTDKPKAKAESAKPEGPTRK